MQYQKKKYTELQDELMKFVKENDKLDDVDIKAHIDALDKKDLKTSGWTTEPLNNVEHDFVSPLL